MGSLLARMPVEEHGIYEDYEYYITFNVMYAHFCAYVKIPENHPYYKKKLTQLEVLVRLDSCMITWAEEEDEGFFIGWSYGEHWHGVDLERLYKYDPERWDKIQKECVTDKLHWANYRAGPPVQIEKVQEDVRNVILQLKNAEKK